LRAFKAAGIAIETAPVLDRSCTSGVVLPVGSKRVKCADAVIGADGKKLTGDQLAALPRFTFWDATDKHAWFAWIYANQDDAGAVAAGPPPSWVRGHVYRWVHQGNVVVAYEDPQDEVRLRCAFDQLSAS
jgi:hypothetical protein